jgi:glycosyltransferase involved in cell wall biosynthesis
MMVVPLRIGGGSRLKILEALASVCPVVSTAIGAEGLNLTPGVHYLQADAPGSFAQTILEAMRRPHCAQETAAKGRTFVAEHNAWPQLTLHLESVLHEARRAAGRVSLFGQ